jgi:cell division transport system permease protein
MVRSRHAATPRKSVRPRRPWPNPLTWLLRHLQVLVASLGRLSRQPLASLMTAAVIGIAVALPAALHLLVANVQNLASTWEGGSTISLFLETDTSEQETAQLAQRLRERGGIAEVQLISAEQALDEFRRLSGFGEALDLLDENPLPAVLLVHPTAALDDPNRAARLAEELGQIAEVEIARADLQWLQRLQAITRIAERAIGVLAVLLATAVLLVIGNTIRLEIEQRHQEIEISKLVGATDAFIRRPFLYEGLWYGLFGGVLASLLIAGSMLLLRGPAERLAGLYQSQFDLTAGVSLTLGAVLLATPVLGLLGSWLAVGRHLRQIQPD